MVLMCFVPAVAHAGTYEVWSCAGPNGEPIAADGWRVEGHAEHSSPVNACAGGGGLYAGLNGIVPHAANVETVTWHFQVPASLKIASYRLWRAAGVGPNYRQRHARVLDGAPVQSVRRRLRRRRRELPGLHGMPRARRPEQPLRRRQPRRRGLAGRRPRPLPQRRLRRRDRHRRAPPLRPNRSGFACTGPRSAPGRQRPGLQLAAGGLAHGRAARSPAHTASPSPPPTRAAGSRRP